jgi:DNA transformation protein and related proteins
MSSSKWRSLLSSDGFRQFVLDQLECVNVHDRAMFGGRGLYSGDHFFGIIASDRLYLKVDAASRPRYEQAKMPAFRPYPDRPGSMQYYEVPVSVLESQPELERWAREAITVAERSKADRSATRARPRKSTVRASRARTRR